MGLRLRTMPFEIDPPAPTYFFDCGIVVRGLVSVWRATADGEFLDVAAALGQSMVRDFASADGSFHPVLSLPDKRPLEPDAGRWSRSPGCYQLKAAMAWWDLLEATADEHFREPYERVLEYSLGACGDFLPGHAERPKVMDRLHAFLYFLEGLLPRAQEPRVAAAIREGIGRAAHHLREIAPEFERSDVYAQLLRMRLYADRDRRPAAGRRRRAIRGGKAGANSRWADPRRRLLFRTQSRGLATVREPGLLGLRAPGAGTLGRVPHRRSPGMAAPADLSLKPGIQIACWYAAARMAGALRPKWRRPPAASRAPRKPAFP